MLAAFIGFLGLSLVGSATFAVESSFDTTAVATLVTQLGLSGVFLWLYLRADTAKTEAMAQLVGFLEKFAPILQNAVDTLKETEKGMSRQAERAREPAMEVTDAVRSMERALGDLRSELRSRS